MSGYWRIQATYSSIIFRIVGLRVAMYSGVTREELSR
jgi:hypothetical protein